MFKTLLLKEIRDHLMTFRFGAALVTTFVLVIISVWVLGDEFVKQQDGFETLNAINKQKERSATIPNQILPVLMRPNSPLSIFAQGPGLNMGNSVTIHRWSVPSTASDEIKNNVLLTSLPSFDLLTIFIFVLSLFGILLSYDAFSGERERGTLKILCTYPPSRSMIYTVKYLGCLTVLAIPFLISLVSALLILLFVHGISFSVAHYFTIGLLIFCALVYSSIFIGIGLVSSSTSSKSSSSLALSLLVWTFLVVLSPSIAQGLARAISPLMAADELTVARQVSGEEATARIDRFVRENNISFNGIYGGKHPGREDSDIFDGTPQLFANLAKYVPYVEKVQMERGDMIFNLRKKNINAEKQQESISDIFGFISPAAQLRSYFFRMTNTSTADFDLFLESTQNYRNSFLSNFRSKGLFDKNVNLLFSRRNKEDIQTMEQLNQRQAERLKQREAGSQNAFDSSKFSPLDSSYFVDYSYSPAEFDPVKGAVALISLLLFSLLINVCGIVVFSRYDIR